MYSVNRDEKYMKELKAFLSENYGIEATKIKKAQRGYYGETWKVISENSLYFIKIVYASKQQLRYKKSFEVMNALINGGIDFVPKIVTSTKKELCTNFLGGVMGVFEWIEGENIETDETNTKKTKMLRKIYSVNTAGLNIKKEDFSADCIDLFNEYKDKLEKRGSEKDLETLEIFNTYKEKIDNRMQSLKYYANKCKGDEKNFYITHGDAGGNMIVSPEKQYLIDWDFPMLAPPERDAWFNFSPPNIIKAFNTELSKIGYSLNQNRMAYYCYYSYIFYLCEYLEVYFDLADNSGLKDYFNGWTESVCQEYDTILK